MFSRKIRVIPRDHDHHPSRSSASRKPSSASARERSEKDKTRDQDRDRDRDRELEGKRHRSLHILSHSHSHNLSQSRTVSPAVRPPGVPTMTNQIRSASAAAAPPQCQENALAPHLTPFTPDPTDVCNTPSPTNRPPSRHSKTPIPPSPPLSDSGTEKMDDRGDHSRLHPSASHHRKSSSSSRIRRHDDGDRSKTSRMSSSRTEKERRHRTDPSRSKASRSTKDPSRRRRDQDDPDLLHRSSGGPATPREHRSRSTIVPTVTAIASTLANTLKVPLTAASSSSSGRAGGPDGTVGRHRSPTIDTALRRPDDSMATPSPPPYDHIDPPRVDYLLKYGGLNAPVTRSLLDLAPPAPAQNSGSAPAATVLDMRAQAVFAPFERLLQGYDDIMNRNGSIAVGSGYRSVARRLLERLEAVFGRNISSEFCACVMCQGQARGGQLPESSTGLNWGEVLEYVAGRRPLPAWPAFEISSAAVDLESTVGGPEAPMQKLDVDVPEAYRHHYVRQGQKTKQAVQSWLAMQPEEPSSPPAELDDDTVAFAIITHLDPHMRQLYAAMLASRSPNDKNQETRPGKDDLSGQDVMSKAQLAIQRLYRLERVPREPECALYLVKNADFHGVVATIAAVGEHEWDILVSGRFDGFLWSGAEEYQVGRMNPPSRPGSVQASRPGSVQPGAMGPNGNHDGGLTGLNGSIAYSAATGGTPTPYRSASTISRTMSGSIPSMPSLPGPMSHPGAPVSLDEENEIAALADVERNIYSCMEALENAFERLHNQAEMVRRQLVDRSAGLVLQNQLRRGGGGTADPYGPDGFGRGGGGPGGGDGGSTTMLDTMTELGPDDSVSNISSYRRRKRKEKSSRPRRLGRPEVVPEE